MLVDSTGQAKVYLEKESAELSSAMMRRVILLINEKGYLVVGMVDFFTGSHKMLV